MDADVKRPHRLGEFQATAIAGNDILSSALYVSGIAAIFAGIYAPIILLCVALVLFFYRSVYREVVGALPVNGGAYNALLNGTSKTTAAIAGVMTVLSYVATAVISAKTAVSYLFQFLQQVLPSHGGAVRLDAYVIPAVLGVLLVFALLVISGVKDSARAASGIFLFHLVTLTTFLMVGVYFILIHHGDIWSGNAVATAALVAKQGGLLRTLFLAFSASLLGVSGFESSANFVEEQAQGVFPKTLRNMALGILVFNPLLALVALNVLSLERISVVKDFVLADAAFHVGGVIFLALIAIDAFLVLCGAVLTSYIGVSGLINRLALDGCLPGSLLHENRRQAHPRIVFAFFVLCSSILLVTGGDLLSLAGVYTISFLSVMTFFAGANLVLRVNRPDLKRPYRAPLTFVVIALLSTLVGVMGNIAIDPKNTGYFLTYFIPAAILTCSIIYRKRLYARMRRLTVWLPPVSRFFDRKFEAAARERIYVFVRHVNRLYRILSYIHQNESGHAVTLVHCGQDDEANVKELKNVVQMIKKGGFFPHFSIQIEDLNQKFSPATVSAFAEKHHINKNRIFIGSIHRHHTFDYEELGGVRVIL